MTYRHGMIAYAYRCPKHGEFESLHTFSENPPAWQPCPKRGCLRRSNRVYGVGMIRVVGGTTPTR